MKFIDFIYRLEEVTGDKSGHILNGGDVHSAKLMQQLAQFKVISFIKYNKVVLHSLFRS